MIKKLFSITLIILILILNIFIYAETLSSEDIEAEAAILIDARTGEILYEKNAEKSMYPASTTKILTAIIILENHSMDEEVIIDACSPFVGGSRIYIIEDEVFTIEQLLYALLIQSANDVAEALAIYHSGSVEEFAKEMNAKAIELGAANTHFTNPHGLPDNNHTTTAYDLAIIARYCMINPDFKKIVGTIRYQIPPTEKQEEIRYLKNRNQFLSGTGENSHILYNIVDGIKTGYTDAAGNCLITSGVIGNQRYITVLLNSPGSYLYSDSRKLLDYGFENFTRHQFVSEGSFIQTYQIDDIKKTTVSLIASKSLIKILPKNIDITKIEQEVLINQNIIAPIAAGEQLGKITYLYNNIEIASVPLISEYEVINGDLVTSIENTIIRRNEDNKLDIDFYLSAFFKILLSFIIYRTIITTLNLRKRKKILIKKNKTV